MKELLSAATVIFILLLLFLFSCVYIPESIGCHARWADSGYEVSYRALSRCRVKVGDHYLPESAIRKMSP